jgi:hypothetical protein
MRLLDWMAANPRTSALVGIWLTAASLITSAVALVMAVGVLARWW